MRLIHIKYSEISLNALLMKGLFNNPVPGFTSGKPFKDLKHLSLKIGYVLLCVSCTLSRNLPRTQKFLISSNCDQAPKELGQFFCLVGSLQELISLDLRWCCFPVR
jgi:hypothetical protein